MGELFVANTTFSTEYDGATVIVNKGATRVREGHPIQAANPQYFDRVDLKVHYEWEDASADSRSGSGRGRPTHQPGTQAEAPSGGVTNQAGDDVGGQGGGVQDEPTQGSTPAGQDAANREPANKRAAKKAAAKPSAALRESGQE